MPNGEINFEEELRRRLKEQEEKNLEFKINLLASMDTHSDELSGITETVTDRIEEILDEFFYAKMGKDTDYETIYGTTERFMSGLSDRNLAMMYKMHRFTDEEMDYVKYTQYTHIWRGSKNMGYGAAYAVRDVLLRNLIIKEFGEESLPMLREVINGLPNETRYYKAKKYFSELFSDHPYGKDISKKLDEALESGTDYFFNDQINCGGYALKIDTCVFPPNQRGFDGKLASLLEKFPFIRLMDEGKIGSDEYLVIYRADDKMGHHFARVESDGTVKEKSGNNPPQTFEGWGNLTDADEAVFAVKKEHEMFGYKLLETNRGEKDLEIPNQVIEYVNNKTRRKPIIEKGKMTNYSDFIGVSEKAIESDDER